MKESSVASNQFGIQLYRKIYGESEQNIALSPLGLHQSMAMVAEGAGGTTLTELRQGLYLDRNSRQLGKTEFNKSTDGIELLMLNQIFARKGRIYLPAFLKTLKSVYAAKLETLDYEKSPEAATQHINQWVMKATKGKISDLIPPGAVKKNTELVLANAVYFNAKWASPFEAAANQKGDFVYKGRTPVTFMNQGGQFFYAENERFQLLEMPYDHPSWKMIVVLPKGAIDLCRFEDELSETSLEALLDKRQKRRLLISIPKFKIERTFDLETSFRQMGIAEAFDMDLANFSKMRKTRPGENIYLSKVIHKSYFAVDEEGTEAAAASAALMVAGSAMPTEKPIVFKADRPFFYMIRDESTNSILFMGRLMRPDSADLK